MIEAMLYRGSAARMPAVSDEPAGLTVVKTRMAPCSGNACHIADARCSAKEISS